MDRLHQANNGVLWDMDGVLVDTGELHFQAWMQALTEFGIPFSQELFLKTFGMNNLSILTFLLGRPPDPAYFMQVCDRKETLFRQIIRGQVRLLPGVRSWLDRLQRLGYRQAVASSAPQVNIETLIAEIQIRPFFSALVSAYDMPGKPDPAVFLEAAHQLGLPPENCVVVEDSVSGIAAARRAGTKCLAVTTTYPMKDLLGADRIVESLENLKEEDFRM
jgi:HAD superfamily hydrolase (TIGR01509 family)